MKLFIGNLPYRTTPEALSAAFSQYGTVVSVSIINDKMTGRSKGFGFVEMSSAQEGNAAINGLNGADYEGRNIVVNEARPREERPRNDFRSRE